MIELDDDAKSVLVYPISWERKGIDIRYLRSMDDVVGACSMAIWRMLNPNHPLCRLSMSGKHLLQAIEDDIDRINGVNDGIGRKKKRPIFYVKRP